MAKTARRPAAKAPAAKRGGALRPVLLAAGLAIYWFVEHQDIGSATDAPIWGYGVIIGVRLLVDFVGALVLVAALQLFWVSSRLAVAYLRGVWLQVSSR